MMVFYDARLYRELPTKMGIYTMAREEVWQPVHHPSHRVHICAHLAGWEVAKRAINKASVRKSLDLRRVCVYAIVLAALVQRKQDRLFY